MSEDYLAQQQPTLTWNTARGVWEKAGMANLLCEHWELFSETWQTSGWMRNGQVFELPMQAHHTTDSESLSSPILPTTRAQHGEDRNNKIYARDPKQPQNLENALYAVLPTPQTMDTLPARDGQARERQLRRGGSNSRRASSGNLREDILQVLPTPTTRDHKDGTEPHERDGVVQTDTVARAVFNSGEIKLPTPTTNGNDRKGPNYSSAGILQELEIANGILPKEYKDWNHAKEKVKWAEPIEGQANTKLDETANWGKFEPAIRRWEEVLGRNAPAPTKPDGKDSAHRLSSAFTEWMMGLAPGWIVGNGLSRNEELKMCGNGVVPQQAALALQVLLEGVKLESGSEEIHNP